MSNDTVMTDREARDALEALVNVIVRGDGGVKDALENARKVLRSRESSDHWAVEAFHARASKENPGPGWGPNGAKLFLAGCKEGMLEAAEMVEEHSVSCGPKSCTHCTTITICNQLREAAAQVPERL